MVSLGLRGPPVIEAPQVRLDQRDLLETLGRQDNLVPLVPMGQLALWVKLDLTDK